MDGHHHLDLDGMDPIEIRMAEGPELDAIVNGSVATDHMEVVALAGIANWGGYVFCSGTLIDATWVLTAAHCLVDIPSMQADGMDVVVFFGSDLINQGATDSRDMRSWAAHPEYNDVQLSNDIGILELDSPKSGVDLAVLNDEPVDTAWVGEQMTFLGFGITSDNADDSGIKRTTEIEVDGYDSHFIQSYTPGTNLCSGDSGGAAFENTAEGTQELAGVNSWVSPGCVGGSNGVTRVDRHIDWILGYAPNALLGGDGAGSNPGGTGTGTGGGEGLGKGSSDSYDRDLGEPELPEKGEYPKAFGCQTAVGSTSGWGLGLLGLMLAAGRRKRG